MALIIDGCSDSSRTYTYLSPRSSASLTSDNYSGTPPRSFSSTSQRRSPSVRIPVPTPTPPLTPPASNEDDIVTRILEYSVGDESQHMHIPGVDEAMYDQIKSHTDARSEHLQYYYDCNACSIVIDTLASDMHESIQEYLMESLKFSLRRWVTSIVANVNVTIMGAVDRDLVSSDGTKLKGKTPDQGFQVKIPGVEVRDYPNIAVEVGYSESHPDLVDDARHWLTQTHDEPVLAVLIFCFKKPLQDSDFADFKKWKAFIEVYER
ncbi:hypothetical protein PILCRDRAFT_16992 [Piloderma croceum F 1598]|uniref:Uncharacterized protein n=1 Tax=Piloderma croceum (strain F 1598) TaxID=765440 RepID=A0A0C3ETY4_PILCF|nr:hypothetical protein PILCRDRAFT_16992 [Piloderma croceum F 1598]